MKLKHLVEEKIRQNVDSFPIEDLKNDLEKLEKAESLTTETYDSSEEKHRLFSELFKKYQPHLLDDLFNLCCNDKSCWNMINKLEYETKHQYYSRKKSFSLADISNEIKDRLSFYGLYMVGDHHDR